MQLFDEANMDNHSSMRVEILETKLLSLIEKQDSLIDFIGANYKKYFFLKYDKEVVSLGQLKDNLDADQVVLNYSINDSGVYIIAIGKDFSVFKRLKRTEDFNTSLYDIINLKNQNIPNQNREDFNRFISQSNTLWKYLIEPVNNLLLGKRLIIIPDGILGYLPFELLLTNNTRSNMKYAKLPYLIMDSPISYNYSITLRYNSYFNKLESRYSQSLVFAPSYNTSSTYQNLPYAIEEGKAVHDIIGGKILLEKDALKQVFIDEGSNYQVIHFAMHAIINDTEPLMSKLVFYSDSLKSIDGDLKLFELYSLPLNAELVTLSACNTGGGKMYHGEGIMSLARGFVIGGVPAVVMTLWEVQDKSSSIIMQYFYKYLEMGYDKDIALQKSKIDFISNSNMLKSNPYYWSAFIVTGDTKPLSKLIISYNQIILFISVLYFMGVLFFIFYRKRKEYD